MAEPSETILSWNVTNWITVLLMAAIGFWLLGLARSWYQSRQPGSEQ
jgi:hypothetical protein